MTLIRRAVITVATADTLGTELRLNGQDFLGGPVTKPPRSLHRGPRFNPWSGD